MRLLGKFLNDTYHDQLMIKYEGLGYPDLLLVLGPVEEKYTTFRDSLQGVV